MSKTFCVKPWVHSCVRTNGNITFCCQSKETSEYNLKTSSIDQWWNSNVVTEMRTAMLNGDKPDACSVCFEIESAGSKSLRQKSNEDYKIFPVYAEKMLNHFKYPTASPIEVEMQLTNLCNLKCLMCTSEGSSSIQSENKKFNINVDDTDYTVTDYEMEQIRLWLKTKPQLLNLRGGEPLIVPEIKRLLEWTVEHNIAKDLTLHISTNGTKFNNKWFDLLSKFKEVRIMVSLDGVGAVNDYIRFGSEWSIIERNVKHMASLPNVNFVIHATIQNLNILSIGNLIDWCYNNQYTFDYELLQTPAIYRFNNLPKELLEISASRISYKPLLDVLHRAQPESNFDKFKREVCNRDIIRKVSILDVIPELEPYWHAETE